MDIRARRIYYRDDPNAPQPNSVVPSATVIVVNDDGAILLIRRTDNGNLARLGGGMDLGGPITQAARREVRARRASAQRDPRSAAHDVAVVIQVETPQVPCAVDRVKPGVDEHWGASKLGRASAPLLRPGIAVRRCASEWRPYDMQPANRQDLGDKVLADRRESPLSGCQPGEGSVFIRVRLAGAELGQASAHDVGSRNPRRVTPAIAGVEVSIAHVHRDQDPCDRDERQQELCRLRAGFRFRKGPARCAMIGSSVCGTTVEVCAMGSHQCCSFG